MNFPETQKLVRSPRKASLDSKWTKSSPLRLDHHLPGRGKRITGDELTHEEGTVTTAACTTTTESESCSVFDSPRANSRQNNFDQLKMRYEHESPISKSTLAPKFNIQQVCPPDNYETVESPRKSLSDAHWRMSASMRFDLQQTPTASQMAGNKDDEFELQLSPSEQSHDGTISSTSVASVDDSFVVLESPWANAKKYLSKDTGPMKKKLEHEGSFLKNMPHLDENPKATTQRMSADQSIRGAVLKKKSELDVSNSSRKNLKKMSELDVSNSSRKNLGGKVVMHNMSHSPTACSLAAGGKKSKNSPCANVLTGLPQTKCATSPSKKTVSKGLGRRMSAGGSDSVTNNLGSTTPIRIEKTKTKIQRTPDGRSTSVVGSDFATINSERTTSNTEVNHRENSKRIIGGRRMSVGESDPATRNNLERTTPNRTEDKKTKSRRIADQVNDIFSQSLSHLDQDAQSERKGECSHATKFALDISTPRRMSVEQAKGSHSLSNVRLERDAEDEAVGRKNTLKTKSYKKSAQNEPKITSHNISKHCDSIIDLKLSSSREEREKGIVLPVWLQEGGHLVRRSMSHQTHDKDLFPRRKSISEQSLNLVDIFNDVSISEPKASSRSTLNRKGPISKKNVHESLNFSSEWSLDDGRLFSDYSVSEFKFTSSSVVNQKNTIPWENVLQPQEGAQSMLKSPAKSNHDGENKFEVCDRKMTPRPPDESHLDLISQIVYHRLWKESAIDIKNALIELRNLCRSDEHRDANIAALYDVGGHVAMMGAMRKWYAHADLQAEGCRALHSAALRASDDFALAAVRCGALETILLAMENFPDDSDVQDRACGALYALTATSNKDASVKLATQLKGVPIVLQAMKAFPGSVCLQQRACFALCSLARWEELRGDLSVVAPIIRQALANHQDRSDQYTKNLQSRGRWVLKRLDDSRNSQ